MEELAKPEGRLIFAGEHTSAKYRGTVHGAWLTGDRAYNDVARLSLKKTEPFQPIDSASKPGLAAALVTLFFVSGHLAETIV